MRPLLENINSMRHTSNPWKPFKKHSKLIPIMSHQDHCIYNGKSFKSSIQVCTSNNAINQYEVMNIHDVKSKVLGTPELYPSVSMPKFQIISFISFNYLACHCQSLTQASDTCQTPPLKCIQLSKQSIFSRTRCGHLKRSESNFKKFEQSQNCHICLTFQYLFSDYVYFSLNSQNNT